MLSRPRSQAGARAVRAVERHSITGNYVVGLAQLCRRHVFVLDAAREVDIACLNDPEAWVEVANDTSSAGDLTLKDGGTTVDVLAAGEASGYAVVTSGTIEPIG